MREIGIGIIGVGVVGSSVIEILQKNQEIIAARSGVRFVIKQGVVSDLSKKRDVCIPLSNEIEAILENDEIEIVIELMGGVDLAYEVAKKVLGAGKSLITANKAMLAYHRHELQAMGHRIGFEASVCGGIPVLKALKDGLGANHILSLKGILNGTSNFILTQMIKQNQSFEESLKAAQKLGYAESDPTLDISGMDAGHKLLILASLAYGLNAKPEEILIEGIEGIEESDIAFAKEFGYVIKLLGIAKQRGDEVELRVHPVLLKEEAMLSKVDGVMNGVSVIGDYVGEMLYYGAGAGGHATASAVISDLIEMARGKNSHMLGFDGKNVAHKLMDRKKIQCRYYIRLRVDDKAGVLAKISSIFNQRGISIQVFLQRESKDRMAELFLITHTSLESNVIAAVAEINKQDFTLKETFFIRIED